MAYFTTKQGYLFLCSDISSEEKRKLDDFLLLLEESGVGRIIEDTDDRKGQAVVRPIIPIVCLRRSSTPSPGIPAAFGALRKACALTLASCI